MESLYIINGGIHQILHLTDYGPAVWMPLGKCIFQDQSIIVSIRRVVDTLSFFIHNDILLIGKCRLRNSIFQVAHPVGFKPQGHFKCIFWYHLIIDRVVITRPAIELSSCSLNKSEQLILSHVLRLLKHHMFEKMCKSGFARDFTA